MQFTRIRNEVLIGNNSYATYLDIEWNSENLSTGALGLGYTFVALNFRDDENIIITPTDPTAIILPSDIALAEQQIQDETFYGPIVLYLNLGYNFRKFW